MVRTDCPSEPTLIAFHRGELPEASLDSVAEHLADCADCDARLTEIEKSTDPLGGALHEMKSSLVGKAVREAANPTVLPAYIGRYEIRERIARGGSGVVYRAWQPDLKRPVAVKVLRGGAAADPDDAARFRQEAEVLGRLRHPNLVQVIEAGEHEGSPFLVMEFIEGGSLDRLLHARQVEPREAARLVESLARAVDVAHQIGIVHRDIKPGNVLLAGEGTTQPKLGDFGLAKGSDSAPLTEAGVSAGTPNYMAPEQADATLGPLGPAADVYGLGGVLYECLTGKPPFSGRSAVKVVQDLLTRDPADPARENPRVPRDLAVICMKCLRKRPGDRYASAAALAEDLARWQAGQPITARAVRTPERVALWVRRNPGLAASLAGFFVALAGGAAVSTFFAVEATARAADADQAADHAKANQTKAEQAAADTKAALVETGKARDAARAAQLESDRLAVELMLEAAQDEAASGSVTRGLDRMVAALRKTPRDDAATRRLIRLNIAAWADRLPVLSRYERVQGNQPRFTYIGPDRDSLLLWDYQPSSNDVLDYAIDASGARVIAVSNEGVVRVLDRATRNPLGPPLIDVPGARTGGGFIQWRFGADADIVYRVTSNRETGECAQAWNAKTGRPLGPAVTTSAFDEFQLVRARDGRLVFVSMPEPGTEARPVRVFDVATGRELPVPPPLAADAVAGMTLDDHRIGFAAGSAFRWWDAATGQPTRSETRTRWRTVTTTVPPGSTRAAVRGMDLRARWVDLATQRPVGAALFAGPGDTHVTGTAEGRIATLGLHEKLLREWEPPAVATGVVGPAPLDERGFTQSAFGLKAAVAFVGDERDRNGRLVDLATGLPIGMPLRGPSHYAVFSPDGRYFAAAARASTARPAVVRVWEVATGQVVASYTPPQYIHSLAFAPDGSAVAIGIVAGIVYWEFAENRTRWLAHPGPNDNLLFTPDGQRLISTARKGWGGQPGVQFWEIQNDGQIQKIQTAAMDGSPFLFLTADGTALWTCLPQSGRLQKWDPATGTELGTARNLHPGEVVVRIAFRPDGGRAAIVHADGTIRQWDTASGATVGRSMIVSGVPVVNVLYSPDGRTLAVGYGDQTVRLWDSGTGKAIGPPLQLRVSVMSVAFAKDGRTLFTMLHDGSMETMPVPVEAHDSPDGLARWLAVASGVRYEGDQVVALTPEEWAAGRAALKGWKPTPAANRTSRLAAVRDAARAGILPAQLWQLDRLVRENPGDWSAYALRADAREAAGNSDGAAADRAKAIQLNKAKYADWCRHAARDALRLGRAKIAIAQADRVLALAKEDSLAQLDRAEGLAMADRPVEAAEALAGLSDRSAVLDLLAYWSDWDERGKWKEIVTATDSLARSEKKPAARIVYRHRQAVALLASDDREGYRRLCGQLAEELGNRPTASEAAATAWLFCFLPDATTDWSLPLRWINGALAALDRQPDSPQIRGVRQQWQVTRGALLFRAGRSREAAQVLAPLVQRERPDPFACAFLALAQSRQGEPLLAWVNAVRAADKELTSHDVWLRIQHMTVLKEALTAVGEP